MDFAQQVVYVISRVRYSFGFPWIAFMNMKWEQNTHGLLHLKENKYKIES